MAKPRKVHKADLDNEAVKEILVALLQEFRQKGLGSAELNNSYEGLSPAKLKELCCAEGLISEVDFDLAMADLDKGELVKTGPLEAYENPPGASVTFLALYSKNEYAYLTEDGYKVAAKVRPARSPRVPMPTVHISGGTFNQSPVGVGAHVQQAVNVAADSGELYARFREEIGRQITNDEKRSIALVNLQQFEAAQDKPTKLERYNQLVGSIADHLTIFTPLLNLLFHQIVS